MIITAKSTPDEQLKSRVEFGFKNIEIQILNATTGEDDFNNTIKYDVDVISVHTPLISSSNNSTKSDISLNDLSDLSYFQMLIKTCELAQKFATHYNHPVNVVIHNKFSKETWEKLGGFLKDIKDVFRYLTNEFPDLYFCIENSTPYSKGHTNEGTEVCDAYFIANYLNKHVSDKFRLVIDTCHLLMTKRCLNAILKSYPKLLESQKSFEESFKDSNGLLQIVHLNNAKGIGYQKDHGTPFKKENKEDMKILKEITKAYEKYGNDAIICLEVQEDDYLNPINMKATYEAFLEAIQNLDCSTPQK